MGYLTSYRYTVMVVDDEPEVTASLKNLLSRKGYNVVEALTGEQALHILSQKKIDVILLDIIMPGIDGNQVAVVVSRRYPEAKIIIITGFSERIDALVKKRCTAATFSKPINLDSLYNKLAEVCQKYG